MKPIKITVTGTEALVTEKPVLTSGMVGLPVEFTFDEAWDGLNKTAVFKAGSRSYPISCQQNIATVPWEVLEKPFVTLSVGVFGADETGEEKLPTVWAPVDTIQVGTQIPDVTPTESTPNVYDQILAVANDAVRVANSVRQDADSGAFIGPAGPKGDAGVVEFIVVAELPIQDIKNVIYLVPALDETNENFFAEYIWVDGAWEQIGTASVQVDFSEYVRKTDYATESMGGVVKTDIRYGTRMVNGILDICAANDDLIINRMPKSNALYMVSQYNRHPIVPGNLDLAVKMALADCKIEWTEEEKAAARALLGIS